MIQRYTNIERMLVNFLQKYPRIKRATRKAWYTLNYHLLRKGPAHKIQHPAAHITYIGEEKQQYFFGYYDKSPFDREEKSILFQKTSRKFNKKPSPENPVAIGIYDLKKKKERILDHSIAWNWQQGSRLMWLNDHSILFNNYDPTHDSYISNIIKVVDGHKQILPFPIYDANREGTFALSLSFERLASLRPDYGYRNKKKQSALNTCDKNEGIWLIDLHQKKSCLLISLPQLYNYKRKESMKNAYHYVNHPMFSPDGENFIFLHRWINKGIRYSRLFASDTKGKQLNCLLDENLISHCCWYDDEIVLCWAKFNSKDNYYLVSTKTAEVTTLNNEFSQFGDGHPSFAPNKKFLLTDTYPNRRRMKTIILIDYLTGQFNPIAEFLEPMMISDETRCDLHPRWSPQGTYIAFDTAHLNKREIGIINVKEIIEKSS